MRTRTAVAQFKAWTRAAPGEIRWVQLPRSFERPVTPTKLVHRRLSERTEWRRVTPAWGDDSCTLPRARPTAAISPAAKVEETSSKPVAPTPSPSSSSKLYADVFARFTWFSRRWACRYFNVFGKRQDPNSAYASSQVDRRDDQGEDVTIAGDGETSHATCLRPENAVQANIWRPAARNHVYNVAVSEAAAPERPVPVSGAGAGQTGRSHDAAQPVCADFRAGDWSPFAGRRQQDSAAAVSATQYCRAWKWVPGRAQFLR